MPRKSKSKAIKDSGEEPIVTRPRRSATRRSVTTYREASDSEYEEEKGTSLQYVKPEKAEDDDTVHTKETSSSSEGGESSQEEDTAKTKLATKKQPKATTGTKKKPLRKKINDRIKDQIKKVSMKRKREKAEDIDDSQYIVSPPKKIAQNEDNPVDWRVHTAIDY